MLSSIAASKRALLPIPGVLWDVGDVRNLLDEYDAVHGPTLPAPAAGTPAHLSRAGPCHCSSARDKGPGTVDRTAPCPAHRGLERGAPQRSMGPVRCRPGPGVGAAAMTWTRMIVGFTPAAASDP